MSEAEACVPGMSVVGSKTRVVIADDDADIRLLVEIAVRKAGLELVMAAANGDDAWEAIQTASPDLVILDVSMPGATGLELCRLIRATPALADIRIMLLSAAVDSASQQAGLSAGADLFTVKPFSPRALASHLAVLTVAA